MESQVGTNEAYAPKQIFGEKEPGQSTHIVQEQLKEYYENTPEKVRHMAQTEAITHRQLWNHLSGEHETYVATKQIFEVAAGAIGLPSDIIELEVYESGTPDAHVQLLGGKLRISTELIKVLDGDAKMVAAVVGHELGHILLQHHKTTKQDSFDPLDERVQGYEHEYQADRVSAIVMNRLGVSPSILTGALQRLSASLSGLASSSQEKTKNITDEYHAWVLSTHPHTDRRSQSLERDAQYYPEYPTTFDLPNIPFTDLSETDPIKKYEDFRSDVAEIEAKGESFPDVFWEENQAPLELINLIKKRRNERNQQFAEENIASEDDIIPENHFYPKSLLRNGTTDTPPLSIIPSEVNKSVDSYRWWKEAIPTLDSVDGYLDLVDDIGAYGLDGVMELLHGLPILQLDSALHWRMDNANEERDDYEKEQIMNENIYLSEITFERSDLQIITSLLVRRWFELAPVATIVDIESVCMQLREYFLSHGKYLPYLNARLFSAVGNIYAAAEQAEKEIVEQLFREYEREFCAGKSDGKILAKAMMPELVKNALNGYEQKIQSDQDEDQARKEHREKNKSDFPEEILDEISSPNPISPDRAKELLALIPEKFSQRGMSKKAFGVGRGYANEEHEHGHHDRLAEFGTDTSANYLSTEDFEEKYFGEGRRHYDKALYGEVDELQVEMRAVSKLWKIAYEDEVNLLHGNEQLSALVHTYPLRSSLRDKEISKRANIGELVYVEDIVDVQEQIFQIEDIEKLLIFSRGFGNPMLSMSASQRLWELFSQSQEKFFKSVPDGIVQEAAEKIAVFKDQRYVSYLFALLIIYPDASYIRDEHVRYLVDHAADEESTMQFASLYCDPPPGVIAPRESSVVMVSESILDSLRQIDAQDKKEVLLYFLGQRVFYSGIDAKYFRHRQLEIEGWRVKSITDPGTIAQTKSLVKARGDTKDVEYREEDDNDEDDYLFEFERNKLNPSYVVDSPDALVILTKASGVPAELLFDRNQMAVTRREQREFLQQVLLGRDGVLIDEGRDDFLFAVSREIVKNSSWGEGKNEDEIQRIQDFISFALTRCPDEKLPDLFLGLWGMQRKVTTSLPDVTTTIMRELGPLFVKAGQYLSNQASLPLEWTHAFRGLTDQNNIANKTLVYETEHAKYGANKVLARIGEKKGEGSMAAVYEGETIDGEHVAIKVVHPTIKRNLVMDVGYLDSLVKYINSHPEQFSVQLPDNLAEVSHHQIEKELSFEQVVENNKSMQDVIARSGKINWSVAAINQEKSRDGFIISSFAEGESLYALEQGARKTTEGEIGLELLRQIFFEECYQGDPNTGNFRTDEGQVSWIDTDHLGRFSKEQQKDLRSLLVSIYFGRKSSVVAKHLASFVENVDDTLPLEKDIAKWLEESRALNSKGVEKIESLLTDFLDFLSLRGVVLKEEYVTLLRALGLAKPFLANIPTADLTKFFARFLFS